MRALWCSTALLIISLLRPTSVYAAPEGGTVVGGAAVITSTGSTTRITQSTNRGIINWNSFDVGASESVDFVQPGRSSITVNRINDSKASQIDGRITANGTIMLLNQNGILFGQGARVDVGGLIASSSDLGNDAEFMAGGPARLDVAGNPHAAIVNKGQISIKDAGLAGFVAPTVENSGIVHAKLGRVTLAGADLATFDLAGDGLIEIAVSDQTLARTVRNKGTIIAEGGEVLMATAAAQGVVQSLISNEGSIETPTAGTQKGRITIKGDGALAQNTGSLRAEGAATAAGGDIDIDGRFVSLGGSISADGAIGGTINVAADTLSLAGDISADGRTGAGGTVNIASTGNIWETATSHVSADGATDGGSIRSLAGLNFVTSGTYTARGLAGFGGRIDITAPAVKMLTATADASGGRAGGQIRVGGEYQGGKNQPADHDDLPNAVIVTIDRGTRLRADGEDQDSDGGHVIVWSDKDTMALGTILARPGSRSGQGGFVEVSSGDALTYGATVQTGQNGRGGQVLLDPKNITIADGAFNPTAIIMGRGYSSPNVALPSDAQAAIGYAVSLDGQQLAVGAHLDNGFGDVAGQSGAVYLYTFTDTSFSGGALQAIIGNGYTGGKNVNVSTLDAADSFGVSVSLNGNRLAVGAQNDDGASNNLSNAGAAYLFSFTDSAFSGGTLQSRIGYGYSGGKNYNLSTLGASDNFGRSLSLNGNRLAVGAPNGDGATNGTSNSGEVYLFSFADSAFTTPTLQATIGSVYSGGKNLAQTLGASDVFGYAVSLDGNRLAVGAYGDDGISNGVSASGAVYLYTFTDSLFSGGALAATLGQGYTGGKNLDMASYLAASDNFGYSLSLNGNRLAVGANGDDGNANGASNSGGVYLFSFTDAAFSGAALEARVGYNYSALGGKNLTRNSEAAASDAFGASVALDGNRLVVGAYGDDGATNFNMDGGAFHFYTFTDSVFTGGTYQGTLGTGYSGGKNIAFNYSTSSDAYNGQLAISLDNNRIAVGLPDDDGFGNTLPGSGAVYLYSFSGSDFSGATLQSIMGANYTGGKNVDLSAYLGANDRFGYSVAMDGNRLAVGAMFDDGNANAVADSGAVYLFTFSDSAFNGGTLQGRIGRNYTGGKNLNVGALAASDYFGSAVALDGLRLAVGAYADDGSGNARSNSGAVYTFTFADSSFTTPTLQSTIGYGYTGGKNYNLSQLEVSDNLGIWGLSLDGNRLAVTAQGDDGNANAASASGAAYLFTFSDSLFSNPTLQATLGYGYGTLGGKNISIPGLAANDYLAGIALEGNILAIGSSRDDGAANGLTDAGAVYIYTFTDSLFSGGALDAVIGQNYAGGKNISTTGFATASDYFGRGVDLNQGTLVVASPGGDGAGNYFVNSGEVYIFRGNGYPVSSGATFATLPTSSIGITPGSLVALLSTPQDVTLQASNDIIIDQAITVNNPSGNGGTLTLQAGRSILVNANITTDNGNLNLFANEDLSAGVIDAQRDAGSAEIRMASGTTIDAGTGAVTLRLEDGTGKTNNTSGNITLNNINAGSLLASSIDPLSSLVLNGSLSASNTGTPITLAPGKDFINNAGAGALSTPAGRWLIYSDSPVLNTVGGLSPAWSHFHCTYGGACTPLAGNGMFYEYGPNLLSVSVNLSRYYGGANPTAGDMTAAFVYKGFQNGDTAASLGALPTPTLDAGATAASSAGSQYKISLSGGSDAHYEFYFLDPSYLTIDKAPITATLVAPLTRAYGDLNSAIDTTDFTYTGWVNGQDESVITDFAYDYGSVDETTDVGTYAVAADFSADNYQIIASPMLTITKRPITATWTAALSRVYGAANPTITSANFNFSGLVNGDASTVITPSATFGGATTASNTGSYTVSPSFSATNYTVTAPNTTLTITKKSLTATVNNASRAYGDANPVLNYNNVTWSGFVNGDTGAVIDAMTLSIAGTANATANAGTTHAITLSGFSDNNYTLGSNTAGLLTINKRDITATVNSTSRAYGDANPVFTVNWNNLANSETGSVIDAYTLAAPTATATVNAGTSHTIALSGFSDNNYNLTGYTAGNLTINKRDITATVNNASRAYGDANPALTKANVTWNNLVNGDTFADIDAVTVNIAGTATATANAGTTHAVTLSGFSDNNYNLTGSTAVLLTINKRDITATVNNTSRAYGDINPAFTVNWNNLANSETGSVIDAYTLAAPTATATANAGTAHTISLSGFSDNNYNLTDYTAGSLLIGKRDITATVNSGSRAYGDTNPVFAVNWNNLANSETGSVIDAYTLAAPTATATANAGTNHVIALSGFSDDNYNLTGYTAGNLSITKRDITATVNNASRAYGDANPAFTVNWNNLANSETGSVIDAYALAAPTATATANAGSNHTIALSGFSDDNYNLTGYTAGSLSITKRDITATVNNASRAYGDANPAFTVNWNNLVNSETGSVIDDYTLAAPTATATSNAGTLHTISLSGFSDDNYNLTGYTTGSLSINKRDITATVNNASRAYGDANPAFTVNWNNLANSETASAINAYTLAAPTATATANAGTNHVIALSGFSDDNYNLTGYNAGSLSITKRDITATVNNVSRAYGDANPAFTVNWNNLANSETGSVIDAYTLAAPTATATANAGTNHGIALSGFSDNNYNLTGYTAGSLSITKRDITATVNNASRAYGDANPAFTVNWNNLANSETGSVIDAFTLDASTATALSNAGTTHAIALTGFSDDNYNLTGYTGGILTIGKRNITAVVDNSSRAYGDANPAFTATWNNLANGEDGSVIDAFTLASPTATALAHAGTNHSITLSGFSDNNYNLTGYSAGTLAITKRDITATVNNASRYYGYADPSLNYNSVVWSNLANGQTGAVIDALTLAIDGASPTAAAGSVQAIRITGFADNDYNLAGSTQGALTITQAPVTLSVQNARRLEQAANPAFGYTLAGLRNGEDASVFSGVALMTPATPASAPGTYAINASGGTAANYYISVYVPGVLLVDPLNVPPPPPASALPNTVNQTLSANPSPDAPAHGSDYTLLPAGSDIQPVSAQQKPLFYAVVPDSAVHQTADTTDSSVLISVTRRLKKIFLLE